MTKDECDRRHQTYCDQLAAHDKRVDAFDAKLDKVLDAELAQAKSLERTQEHLEAASATLEQAAKTINAQSKVQDWMQSEISKSRSAIHGENWKLIVTLCAALLIVAGLKAGGLL